MRLRESSMRGKRGKEVWVSKPDGVLGVFAGSVGFSMYMYGGWRIPICGRDGRGCRCTMYNVLCTVSSSRVKV